MIALDASVLIAQFDAGDALHTQAAARIEAVSEEPLIVSSITLAEVLVDPARRGGMPTFRTALSRLGVMEIGLPADAAERLALLRAETGLRLPDCCVLLAAEDAGAKAVLTFDGRLGRAAGERGFG